MLLFSRFSFWLCSEFLDFVLVEFIFFLLIVFLALNSFHCINKKLCFNEFIVFFNFFLMKIVKFDSMGFHLKTNWHIKE